MKNWKTTLAGIAALLGLVAKVIAAGHIDWSTDGPVILTALGLFAAKDYNTTGGTVTQ